MGRFGDVQTALTAAILAFTATGCARQIDLAKVPTPDTPALTIPYTGVREETRLYPDYGPIGASILTDEPVGKPTKKGKAP